MLVSFSGLDGSGKSTHARATAEFFRQRGQRVSYVRTHRLTTYALLGMLLGSVSQKSVDNLRDNLYSLKQRQTPLEKLATIVRQPMLVLDVVLVLCWTAWLSRVLRQLVICDRHLLDVVVQMRYLGLCGDWLYYTLLRILPLADVPIYLKLSAQQAYARKPEYPLSHFESKCRLYQEWVRARDMIEVSSVTFEQSQSDIERAICARAGWDRRSVCQ